MINLRYSISNYEPSLQYSKLLIIVTVFQVTIVIVFQIINYCYGISDH